MHPAQAMIDQLDIGFERAIAARRYAESLRVQVERCTRYIEQSWRAKADEVCGRLPDDVQ